MLFLGVYPHKCPHFFGGILRIPVWNAVPDKALQANEWAMLSNIGDISEDVHTYVLTRGMCGSRSEEGPLFGDTPPCPLKEEP